MNTDFVWDKVAGIVAIVINICCVIAVTGLASLLAAVGLAAGSLPGLAAGAFVGIVMIAAVSLSLLGVIAGVGMLQGRRWGFLIGAIVFGLAALTNGGGGNTMGVLIEAGLAIYCLLRLTGNVGPKIRD